MASMQAATLVGVTQPSASPGASSISIVRPVMCALQARNHCRTLPVGVAQHVPRAATHTEAH